MNIVGAYEAKTHLSKLLERVAKGERITITKYGVPVAILQPPDTGKKYPPENVIEEIKKFRRGNHLKGDTIKEMINAGRR